MFVGVDRKAKEEVILGTLGKSGGESETEVDSTAESSYS